MRIAFYAPLKPPTHPVPSGDRRMARLLMAALSRANHRVELASRFRSRDGTGDPQRQADLAATGRHMAARLIRDYRTRPPGERPELWFTYHLYYKAPDWLGPAIADALGIPYVVAEASHAGKRSSGAWALGHDATAAAIRRADAIISLSPADIAGIKAVATEDCILALLKPFVDGADFAAAATSKGAARAALAQRFALNPAQPWLLTVAMMREGDKLASYRVLAEALGHLRDLDWQLLVVGDGPGREEVEAAMARLGHGRVRLAGARTGDELPAIYAAADIYVWPAINEAFGMALLEAEAAGVPVVAGAAGGVAAIVAQGRSGLLTTPGDAAALATAVRSLLADPARRANMGQSALDMVAEEHDVAGAAGILDRLLRDVAERRRGAA